MADRYWVGGTGTWDGTSTTNWASSSGGASGASVPTASDNVFFDANSNISIASFIVTMATTPRVCNDITISGLDGAMTLAGSSVGLTISGSLLFPASGLTCSYTGTTTFNATTGKTVNFNGVALASQISFSGAGGSWTLEGALSTSSSVVLGNGTLNTNGYSVTSAGFGATGSNTRTLTLGATTWTITSGDWNASGATNLTVNRGTSTINMTGTFTTKYFFPGGKTWGVVNQGGSGKLIITGSTGATFANLTNTVQPVSIEFVNGYTYFFDAFSISGTSGNLVSIFSSSNGLTFTLSKVGGGIVSCDYLSIKDSIATVSNAAWYAGNNSTNVSGNTGWIFTAAPGSGMLFFFN